MSPSPRISLCLIARDEAAMIEGCLASAAGAVDELVVVDTGSADATPELARRAGARVIPFTWRNDFAAARNASLAEARGDWVLVLDADERLAPGAAAALREAVRRPRADLGMLLLHHASHAGAAPSDVLSGRARRGEPIELPRLLRRTPDLAYEGEVHEQVHSWLRRRGGAMMRVRADIVHLGGAPELRRALGKSARNVALLRRRFESDPDDLEAAGYLGLELQAGGAMEEALAVVERAWAGRGEASAGRRRLALARAVVCNALRRHADVVASVEDEERRAGTDPELAFLRGCGLEGLAAGAQPGSAERSARLSEAEVAFRAALGPARPGATRTALLEGASSWQAATHLGTVLLVLGRAAEAASAFEVALAGRAGSREAKLGLAEARLRCGDPLAALQLLGPLLGDTVANQPEEGGGAALPGTAAGLWDTWWLAAETARALGSHADAALFLQRGEAAGGRFTAWHRAEAHGR